MEENKQKIRLMLVEDHILTRIGLKASLEKYSNLEIIAETANGKEAVDIAKKEKPALVIMDINILELDGIEATRMIKEVDRNIKVIMLTSHDSEKEIIASFASGADGYCLKDTSPEQLYTAITSVYEGNAWLSSQVAEKVLRNLYGKDISQIKQTDLSKKKTDTPQQSITIQSTSSIHIPIIPLSERELEVLKLIVDGKSNQEIGEKLFVTLATVKTHVKNILNKLSVDDRTQAAVKAMREGLVTF